MQKGIIIITGASGGMGGLTARAMAAMDFTVIATGRNKKRLKQLQTSINEGGGQCLIYDFDLSNYIEIADFCKFIRSKFKKIDWLVSCAGYFVKNESVKNTGALLRINTLGPIYLTKLLYPSIQKGLIYISSSAGLQANGFFPVYSTSKAGLNAFAYGLARNTSDKKIITICPGPTNTPMRKKIDKEAGLLQGPELISNCIEKIVAGKSRYRHGDVVLIKDKKVKLVSRIVG